MASHMSTSSSVTQRFPALSLSELVDLGMDRAESAGLFISITPLYRGRHKPLL